MQTEQYVIGKCFVCGRYGWCCHREPEVVAAEVFRQIAGAGSVREVSEAFRVAARGGANDATMAEVNVFPVAGEAGAVPVVLPVPPGPKTASGARSYHDSNNRDTTGRVSGL